MPRDVLSARCEFFSYLDAAGYRYYLPAAMLLSLDAAERNRSETPQRTYWSLLPIIDVRDFGKGEGSPPSRPRGVNPQEPARCRTDRLPD